MMDIFSQVKNRLEVTAVILLTDGDNTIDWTFEPQRSIKGNTITKRQLKVLGHVRNEDFNTDKT